MVHSPVELAHQKPTKTEIECLRDAFDWIDKDKDGRLGLDDIRKTFQSMNFNCNKREIEDMIWEVDENLDNYLSWEEVVGFYNRVATDETGYEPQKIFPLIEFLMFDKAHTGQLTVDDTLDLLYVRFGKEKLEKVTQFLFGEDKRAQFVEKKLKFEEFLIKSEEKLKKLSIGKLRYILPRSYTQFNKITHRTIYWPPPKEKRTPLIELPSGKKIFIFNGKRDQDGKEETMVCFLDNQYKRLMVFNKEEIIEFEKLFPRLDSYFELWEEKYKTEKENIERLEELKMVEGDALRPQ